jgi:ribosome-binding protein aMBF1 (putative translation factor)
MSTLRERGEGFDRPVKITITVPVGTLIRLEGHAHDCGWSREEAFADAVAGWNVRREQSLNRQNRLLIQRALREAMDRQPVEELLERFREQMEEAPAKTLEREHKDSVQVLTSSPGAPNVSAMALVPQPLRARREALGMTRQELAALVKCSMTALQTLEGGYNAANSGVRDRAEAVLTQAEREAQAA